MIRALTIIAIVLVLGRPAAADKPRVLVLPLPAQTAVDPDLARAFDARFLVALEDTRRVTTVTLEDELECTTPKCLAEAGAAARAGAVVALSIVRERDGLTIFATLLDTATASPSRRAELVRLSPGELATTAPSALARRLIGATPRAATVGVIEHGRSGAGAALAARLAALRSFTVVPADRADATLTHRAEVRVTQLSIVTRRHHVHHYLDGVLVASFAIVDLTDNRVVFTKTVNITVSRRARYSSDAEVSALLVEAAVQDWMTAFLAARTETLLKGDSK
ncbi:MAG: hypothetical protein WKG01_21315 [Kofleriaceae bacterium]